MQDDEKWQEPFEDDGVTLGPEEALKREIERSKALKVDRLKLRDRIETLEKENAALRKKIAAAAPAPPAKEKALQGTSDSKPALKDTRYPLATLIIAFLAGLFLVLWLRA
jgi:septal ring factor EnvC (AmiA/AmiB activator)